VVTPSSLGFLQPLYHIGVAPLPWRVPCFLWSENCRDPVVDLDHRAAATEQQHRPQMRGRNDCRLDLHRVGCIGDFSVYGTCQGLITVRPQPAKSLVSGVAGPAPAARAAAAWRTSS
jgi:hypothetical protein